MIGRNISHYRIVAKLGQGGMGVVYRAQDTRLDRPVAIKVMSATLRADGERRARFVREAKAASALNHSNIIQIYDIDQAEGMDFIAMELVEGQTLGHLLAGRPLPETEALEYAVQVADALSAAHASGILHRDLKPANIMVTEKGVVKVLDFGLAKLLEPDSSEATTLEGLAAVAPTHEGVILGTAAYMSPEQAAGRKVDARSDIFSFGSVLYEMVTGRRAFHRETTTLSLAAVLKEEPETVIGVSPELERIIARCLRKDPDRRLQTMSDLKVALEDLREESQTTRIATPPRVKRRWIAFVAVAGALVLTAAAGYFGWSRRAPRPDDAQTSSIVALPAQFYGAGDLQYLSDAIPGSLSTQLAKIEGLETKAPPSSVDFQRIGGDLSKVADLYGATLFVSSSVTAAGDRLVLNIRVVEAGTRRVVWSEEYTGARTNYLALIQRAAEGVRAAVRPASAPLVEQAASRALSEAELAFRRGLYLTGNRAEDVKEKLASFELALELDPGMADAAAAMALVRANYFKDYVGGEIAARRALAIDPRCARAWAALAYVEGKNPNGSRKSILDYSLRGAALAPRDGGANYGLVEGMFHGLGAITLAVEAGRQVARLDPLNSGPAFVVPLGLLNLGRRNEAQEEVERRLAIEPNRRSLSHFKLRLHAELGRPQEAADLFKQLNPTDSEALIFPFLPQARYWLAVAQRDSGQEQVLRRVYLKWINDPKSSADGRDHLVIDLAAMLARQGLTNPALETLERGDALGVLIPYDWLLLNPDLESIRADARFQKLAEKSKAHFLEFLGLVDDARRRGEFPKYLERPLADLLVKLRV